MRYHPVPRVLQPDAEVVDCIGDEECPRNELSEKSHEELIEAKLDEILRAEPDPVRPVRPLLALALMAAAFVLAIFSVWSVRGLSERLNTQEQQLTEQAREIEQIARKHSTLTSQSGPLQKIIERLEVVTDFINGQSKDMARLEAGQRNMQAQMQTGLTQMRKEVDALKQASRAVSVPKTETPSGVSGTLSTGGAPVSAHQHGEFRQGLKPTAKAYQALSGDQGVWMVPRPGFKDDVPVSVIGKVTGVGVLVHCWTDGKDYFLTESGSWLADQQQTASQK
jgi:type II secretory pathway component PulM